MTTDHGTDLVQLSLTALAACGARIPAPAGSRLEARSPITGQGLVEVGAVGPQEVEAAIARAQAAFLEWRSVPAPQRGFLVKRLGRLLEEHTSDLATLVTVEVGKIRSEALGEVQEMIDICDFAVGLSRQLEGRTMPSERPGHRLMETWHPRGVVSVISAFNFPAAVWAWNTAIALVCGDPVIWKPSELTPLTSLACSAILDRAIADCGAPADVHQLVLADRDAAAALIDSPLVAVVSATGSERMGADVGPRVAARFGHAILELGGNNAAIVAPSADLELAVRGIVFAAAGTAGQRCTSLRRVIVHTSIADDLVARLAEVYARLPLGSPLDESTLVGPLIDQRAFDAMQAALRQAEQDGGTIVAGGERHDTGDAEGYYVRPALVRMPAQTAVVRRETFAPVLYVLTYRDLDEAIALQNDVPQGLSSSIFTLDQREAEAFMSSAGSDCGIVNVNIGTSGAEIGGAFGGEKSTGGGRESGSDAWRGYMRRATNTVNYSHDLPLAQGVSFGVTDGSAAALPSEAEVVIIGGGVMGTSIAFHLAEAGVGDVLLLERDALGSGSTSKAAGGVRAQFSDPVNIALGARSLTAFERFPERPGQVIDLHQVGYLFLLTTPEEVATYEQSVALQNEMAVPSRMIGPAEAHALSPGIDVSDVLAAAFHPRDGYCSPESVVLGYATGARRHGAVVRTGVEVTGIDVAAGTISSVSTSAGTVRTGAVVCAAGAWSRQVGALAGLVLPVDPLRRQILITEPLPAALLDTLPETMPMTIDAGTTFYLHREGPGVLFGMSYQDEEPGFRHGYSEDWLPSLMAAVERRCPALLEVGIAHRWSGLYEDTPDHNALIGESAAVSRLLYATGFSGHGFLQAPAVGEVVRDLYLGRQPVVDVSPLSADRFATGDLRGEVNIV